MAQQRDSALPADSLTASEKSGSRYQAGVQATIYVASQWQLMWLHFKRHRLAVVGSLIVILLYLSAIFSGFLAPYNVYERFSNYIHAPPQRLRFVDEGRVFLRPFVYGSISKPDPNTFSRIYEEDRTQKYFLLLFVRGQPYKLIGLLPTDLHLFGVEEGGTVFLLGTDDLGRDLLSRVLVGSTISLSIGLVGVITSFVLGAILGGVSGFYGGITDTIIQRIIEFLTSMPTIPLWMALSAAVPADWPPTQVYFAITLILSLRGWCGLARVVRGKLLELREEEFVMAAQLVGSSDWRLITRHLLPSFMSYLIVDMTLAIPSMILGETALSFLGLGLRPPVVSWGVLLHQAQNVRTIIVYPWLLAPAIFVVVTVLAFNFMGDGLRDAADPYKL